MNAVRSTLCCTLVVKGTLSRRLADLVGAEHCRCGGNNTTVISCPMADVGQLLGLVHAIQLFGSELVAIHYDERPTRDERLDPPATETAGWTSTGVARSGEQAISTTR